MPLNLRHNITAPPLRGCVDHLTADAVIVEYNRMIGVSNGCPVSLLVSCQKEMTRIHGRYKFHAYVYAYGNDPVIDTLSIALKYLSQDHYF